jgi:hypothetical protein
MGGLRIFRAESSPGQVITKEKFTPQPGHHGLALGHLFDIEPAGDPPVVFGGMSLFDSLCHAFGTVSTSGYSPKNASIGHYNSAYFDWVIIVFMFLGGMTFMLFYHMMKGNWKAVQNQHRVSLVCGVSALFLRDGDLDPVEGKHLRQPGRCHPIRHLSGDVHSDHHRVYHRRL